MLWNIFIGLCFFWLFTFIYCYLGYLSDKNCDNRNDETPNSK